MGCSVMLTVNYAALEQDMCSHGKQSLNIDALSRLIQLLGCSSIKREKNYMYAINCAKTVDSFYL